MRSLCGELLRREAEYAREVKFLNERNHQNWQDACSWQAEARRLGTLVHGLQAALAAMQDQAALHKQKKEAALRQLGAANARTTKQQQVHMPLPASSAAPVVAPAMPPGNGLQPMATMRPQLAGPFVPGPYQPAPPPPPPPPPPHMRPQGTGAIAGQPVQPPPPPPPPPPPRQMADMNGGLPQRVVDLIQPYNLQQIAAASLAAASANPACSQAQLPEGCGPLPCVDGPPMQMAGPTLPCELGLLAPAARRQAAFVSGVQPQDPPVVSGPPQQQQQPKQHGTPAVIKAVGRHTLAIGPPGPPPSSAASSAGGAAACALALDSKTASVDGQSVADSSSEGFQCGAFQFGIFHEWHTEFS